jgi:hypothetical protein
MPAPPPLPPHPAIDRRGAALLAWAAGHAGADCSALRLTWSADTGRGLAAARACAPRAPLASLPLAAAMSSAATPRVRSALGAVAAAERVASERLPRLAVVLELASQRAQQASAKRGAAGAAPSAWREYLRVLPELDGGAHANTSSASANTDALPAFLVGSDAAAPPASFDADDDGVVDTSSQLASLLHISDVAAATVITALTGTPLGLGDADSLAARRARLREGVRRVCEHAASAGAECVPLGASAVSVSATSPIPWLSERLLLWAHGCFVSRAMRLPPRGAPAMVPLFDLANHSPGAASRFDGATDGGDDATSCGGAKAVADTDADAGVEALLFGSAPALARPIGVSALGSGPLPPGCGTSFGASSPTQPLTLRLGRALAAGEAVSINYGALANEALLLRFGFALAGGNCADTLRVCVAAASSAEAGGGLRVAARCEAPSFLLSHAEVPAGLLEAAASAAAAATTATVGAPSAASRGAPPLAAPSNSAPLRSVPTPAAPSDALGFSVDANAAGFFLAEPPARAAAAAAWLRGALVALSAELRTPQGAASLSSAMLAAIAAYRDGLARLCDATREATDAAAAAALSRS